MSWRQQKLCEDIGYLDKLKQIDKATLINQRLLDSIAETSVDELGISFRDYDLLKNKGETQNASSTNYRVIESLSHFLRDWNKEYDCEIVPMMSYIEGALNSLIPIQERSKTCIVIPGSGLGRIAHEIAKLGDSSSEKYGSVHAVEYSGLMYLCNEFIYSSQKNSFDIYPNLHSCSNYYDTQSQMRSLKLEANIVKPSNLELHHKDFRYFKVPNKENFSNIVIVSAFFIDTAENILDYMDKFKEITAPSKSNPSLKNGYWINVGPLKYGSASQAELNGAELVALRKEMGWIDLNHSNSLKEPSTIGTNGLVGYVTDKESMWQGYYGLDLWTSMRKENPRK